MFAPAEAKWQGFLLPDKKPTSAGGIVFATGPDEFLVVGKDFRLTFTPLIEMHKNQK